MRADTARPSSPGRLGLDRPVLPAGAPARTYVAIGSAWLWGKSMGLGKRMPTAVARGLGMNRFRVLVRLGLHAAALLATCNVAVAVYRFTSVEGGYSVAFPAAPQEQIDEDANARKVLSALNHDNGYYAVVHVDHKFDLNTDDELEGNVTVFTKQINAPTQLRKKRKFTKGPGEQLPAEEFTFESSELVGKGIVIVEGRRVYMVTAFGTKPHDRKAAVDRFMKSFKFKGPEKKEKAPQKEVKSKPKS